jgi:hypothetical protein
MLLILSLLSLSLSPVHADDGCKSQECDPSWTSCVWFPGSAPGETAEAKSFYPDNTSIRTGNFLTLDYPKTGADLLLRGTRLVAVMDSGNVVMEVGEVPHPVFDGCPTAMPLTLSQGVSFSIEQSAPHDFSEVDPYFHKKSYMCLENNFPTFTDAMGTKVQFTDRDTIIRGPSPFPWEGNCK